MNTEERLVSYQVNECLKQRDELREQVDFWHSAATKRLERAEAAEAELEQERQTSGTLYKDWLKAQAEVERLRHAEAEAVAAWKAAEADRWQKAVEKGQRPEEVVPAAMPTDDPACSDPLCSYRAEALTRGAMSTLTPEAREVIEWLLPYATYPECICQKTEGCECDVEEAQRNYYPTIEKARSLIANGEGDQ